MPGLGLSLTTGRPVAWWMPGAVYAADFVNDRYMRDGAVIAPALAYSVSRNAPKFVADTQGRWHRFAADTPARTDRGLHLDPAVTYAGLNSALAGAVPGIVGSGGVRPTGWSPGTTAGLTTEIIGAGEDNGIPFLRVRLFGTTDSTDLQWMFDESTVVATPGQTWTGVALVRHVSGSIENITPALRLAEQADGTFLASSQTGFAFTPQFTLASVTRNFEHPSTTRARLRLRLTLQSVGQAVNLTLDVALTSLAPSSVPIALALTGLGTLSRPADITTLLVNRADVVLDTTTEPGGAVNLAPGEVNLVATPANASIVCYLQCFP